MDQSNQERQEEELQVLQAIYMSEFEDLRTRHQIEVLLSRQMNYLSSIVATVLAYSFFLP